MNRWTIAALATMTCAPAALAQQNGVTTIPTDPPPTGMQKKVPGQIGPSAKPGVPLLRSPSLAEINLKLSQGPLSLDDAISVALAVNPSLAQAGENLFYAQGRTNEAKSAFMPTIGVAPGAQFISGISTPAYVVAATMPLDISHLLAAATDQAHFQEIGARLDVNRVRNEIIYRVENAFYTSLRSQALSSVAQENLANSEERLRDAQARYKARAVAYIDVVRAQTDVADAQKQLIQAQSDVNNNLAILANSMGLDVTTHLQITDRGAVTEPPGLTMPAPTPIPTPEQVPMPKPPSAPPQVAAIQPGTVTATASDLGPEFRAVVDEALHTRPEVLEADAQIAAAQKGVILANRSDLPSLSLGVGYFDLRTQSDSRVNQPQAFLAINIPIFDGGLARARTQEAKATVASAMTTKRQAVDAVTLDVQQAYLALVQARDQVAVASQALNEARVAFDLAKVRYNTGVASHAGISPLIELSDAQAALTLAEQNQVNALYGYNGARAQLDRSAGRFAFIGNGPGYASVPPSSTLGGGKPAAKGHM